MHKCGLGRDYTFSLMRTDCGPPGAGDESRRVIAVEESISFNLVIHPSGQASEILATARSWGVLDSMCRTRTGQAGQRCSYPLSNCLVFAPEEGAFDNDELVRACLFLRCTVAPASPCRRDTITSCRRG
jgi:hypothetical protein